MDTPPEDLKYISHYLQRANELRTREPVVSYYCNYYAAKLAISKGSKNKDSSAFLVKLLDLLEQQKKDCGDNDAITNDVVGYAHIENFALKVFLNADNEDRSGKASRKTAKTFMAAATFLELLKTFGDIDVEIEEKIKYAKWKATDIMKAFRDGRVPTPGPPGGLPQHDELPPSSDLNEPPKEPSHDSQPPGDLHDQHLPAATTAFAATNQDHSSIAEQQQQHPDADHFSTPDQHPHIGQFPPPPSEQHLNLGHFPTPPSEQPAQTDLPPTNDRWQNFPLVPAQRDYVQDVSSTFSQQSTVHHPASPNPSVEYNFPTPPAPATFNQYGNHSIANFPSPPSDLTSPQLPPHNPYYDPHQQLPPAEPWSYTHPQQPSPYEQLAPANFPPFPYQQPSIPQSPSPLAPQVHQISPSAPPQQPHRQSYAQPMPPSPAQSASPQLLSKPFTPAPPIPIDHTVVSTAQKHAKWAISALNYDDIKTARENLLKALDLLKNF